MRAHLMGVGGAGVSALARVFLARGDEVSGCDLKESETTSELEAEGLKFVLGHNPEHVLGQDLLVYSGAIKKSPELDAARAMGVKVLSRAEMLAQMINDADSIAVAGTAGKTTVTHMVGHILVLAGYDPTVLAGDVSLRACPSFSDLSRRRPAGTRQPAAARPPQYPERDRGGRDGSRDWHRIQRRRRGAAHVPRRPSPAGVSRRLPGRDGLRRLRA